MVLRSLVGRARPADPCLVGWAGWGAERRVGSGNKSESGTGNRAGLAVGVRV